MSTQNALNEADQELLRVLAATEAELPLELGAQECERFASTVNELRRLCTEARHQRLVLQAQNLIALLAPDPVFPADMRNLTTNDAAFLVPLAGAARSGRKVSGAPLGVWVGMQRPAMGAGPWKRAAREVKDLVGLTAPPVVPGTGRGPLIVTYPPLARGSGLSKIARVDLPSVVLKPMPEALRNAADDAVQQLGSYARTLESFSDASDDDDVLRPAGTVAPTKGLPFAVRAARLPEALFELGMKRPEGVALAERIDVLRRRRALQMDELLALLLPEVEQPDRRHIVAISELLQRFGVGFEPDPRFLAPLPHPSTVVTLFDCRPSVTAPSSGFAAAAAELVIGLAMAGTDGYVDAVEIQHVSQRASSLVASGDEQARLALRADALASNPPDFDRLLQRLKSLKPAAKEVVADLLVGVASTDGQVSVAEYEALQQAYRAMRLGKPALDAALEKLRGDVILTDAVGAGPDRRSQVGKEQDDQRFKALSELLLGS